MLSIEKRVKVSLVKMFRMPLRDLSRDINKSPHKSSINIAQKRAMLASRQ